MSDRISGKRRFFSIRAIAPSVVTLLAFCAGLSAIRFGLAGKWELCCAATVAAGVLDGLDGTVARLLKASSKFGAELDSLSDISVFGICPAIILYIWALEDFSRFGWAAVLVYAIACILRLARFNARLDDEDEPQRQLGYNTGIPAPMGAGLMISPIAIDFTFMPGVIQAQPAYLSVYILVISMLMVSAIPTISLKAVRVSRQWFVLLMLAIGILITSLVVFTWETLLAIAFVFLLTMPVTWIHYRRKKAAMAQE